MAKEKAKASSKSPMPIIEGTIELGDFARSTVTGFEGIVVAQVFYLQGCDQFCLQPQGLKPDGDFFDARYFDAPYVDLLEKQRVPNRNRPVDNGPGAPPSGKSASPHP